MMYYIEEYASGWFVMRNGQVAAGCYGELWLAKLRCDQFNAQRNGA